jgi:response regulator RpfG family c-di-GMP phosphodiesterase
MPETSQSPAPARPEGAKAFTILCVDDEPNILSALRRLFRARGYQVLLAPSGQAGLELLEREAVDLVISDMRMPEMDGARFLEQVRSRWPDPVRLLLTGYADITSIIEAINRGEIYRYITKPWDDNDILLIVHEALARRALELEKKRLQALASRQNEELRTFNAHLEALVRARSAKLLDANDLLQGANDKLKSNFITSVKVFTALVELRGGNLAGHARRVADLARRLALKCALDEKLAQEIFIAALLHEVGKVGFADELLATPVVRMDVPQLALYRSHPARAEQLLMPLQDLKGSVDIIAAQLERFDGAGFPKRLVGNSIPLGARILALASDYDNLQMGALAQRHLTPDEALAVIVQGSGKRYDPAIVPVFVELLAAVAYADTAPAAVCETPVMASALQVGMVLSRDLITPSGLLMLSTDHLLDDRMIRKIIDFEKSAGLVLTAHVRVNLDS